MFGLIKNRWREARGAMLLKEVEGIVQLVSGYSDDGGRQFAQVYLSTIASIYKHYGAVATLSDAVKLTVAKGLAEKANAGRSLNPIATTAILLVAAALEAETLPGEAAAQVVAYAMSFGDMADKFINGRGDTAVAWPRPL